MEKVFRNTCHRKIVFMKRVYVTGDFTEVLGFIGDLGPALGQYNRDTNTFA